MADSLVLPLGEVIAWKCTGTTQAGLVAALKAAGLDASIARELAPRFGPNQEDRRLPRRWICFGRRCSSSSMGSVGSSRFPPPAT